MRYLYEWVAQKSGGAVATSKEQLLARLREGERAGAPSVAKAMLKAAPAAAYGDYRGHIHPPGRRSFAFAFYLTRLS